MLQKTRDHSGRPASCPQREIEQINQFSPGCSRDNMATVERYVSKHTHTRILLQHIRHYYYYFFVMEIFVIFSINPGAMAEMRVPIEGLLTVLPNSLGNTATNQEQVPESGPRTRSTFQMISGINTTL